MRRGRVGGVVAPCGFWYGAGPMSTAFSMIADSADLRTLVDRLQEEAVLAFDTEFTWERTYYARLGLVQLAAADGRCFLIDPLAVGDLAPLGELLANARIVKILHDAPQDLMILRRATGIAARNVFDTRLAAGFAGLASTLSLGNLLAETLGVHLAKAHTRADWLARPLAPEELDYAADDVRYLPEVAERLRARARTAGVEAWLDEDLAALDDPALTADKPVADAYLRIRAAANLAPRPLAALRELAAWREQAARTADLPRRWLLEDGELVAIASALPQTPDGLKLKPPAVARWGADLLAAVRRAQEMPEADLPPRVFQPPRAAAFRKELDAVLAEIQTRAAARGVDPALVCGRNDLARLLQAGPAAKPEDHALLRGWRAELAGDLGVRPQQGVFTL